MPSAWERVAEEDPESLTGANSTHGAVQVWARTALSQMQEREVHPFPSPGVTQRLPSSTGPASPGSGRRGSVSAHLWRSPDHGKFKTCKEERWDDPLGV